MKRYLAILLCAFLLFAAVPAFAVSPKEEVVYGILDHDGSVKSIYVVNSFIGGKVTDYGDYSFVRNMTTSEKLTQNGDAVNIDTVYDRFYYQGTLKSSNLPWKFAIQYSLDGKTVSPSELAGKSGALTIDLSVSKNPAVNPVFYDNYMLQISLTMDTQKCDDIRSENATIASAGRNKVIAHTVLPGKDAQIKVSANVRNFTMAGIEINAMPFSMPIEMPDTDALTEDMTLLSDAVGELNDGVARLSDGISQTYSGAKKLADGSANIAGGLKQLETNSEQLLEASAQIQSALSTIAGSLSNQSGGGFSLAGFDELPATLRQLANGLKQITGSMETLKNAYAAAYAALRNAISTIPDADVDPAPLYAAAYGNQELTRALDRLMEYYKAAKTVKGTYAAVKEAFDAVEGGLETISGSVGTIADSLTAMADAIEQAMSGMDFVAQLRQLKQGLTELSANYSQFHQGLDGYMSAVKTLSGGYGEVHKGLQSLKGGIGQLDSGAKELSSGTGELNEAVADLPNEVQSQIDELTKDYEKPDFTPVSFVSDKNANVSAVQFVLKTGAIELPETVQTVAAEPVKLTFWQKLLRLFGLYP